MAKKKKTMKKKAVKKKKKLIAKRKVRKAAPKRRVKKAAKKPAIPLPPPAEPAVPTVALREGEPAPGFTAATDQGNAVSLSDFLGRKLVLYFYPKDDTPGCTKEACAFRDGISRIQAKGATVLGVSADSVESHQQFRDKYSLNFPLLADPDKKIVQDYGVWKEKNMYGRTYMGIERTTFLIDEAGRLQRIFPKVNVEAHYDEVLAALG